MADHKSELMYSIEKSIKKKEALFSSNYIKYAMRAFLACMYLALGVALCFALGDKVDHVAHGLGKVFYAGMFGWCLVMILYMNAELGTSNMMYMTVAVHRKYLPLVTAAKILFTCILFNLVGGIVVSFFLAQTDVYNHIPADHYLLTATAAKLAKPAHVQFVEGIFANMVVNIAVYLSIRLKDDAARVMGLIGVIFIFAFLGYEHVIANFATFSLAFFTSGGAVPGMTVGSVLSNFLFSGLGNFVGGGICIGLLYSWLNTNESVYVD